MQSFKKYTLENGLRIILAPQPASPAATVLVLVEAGSKYEIKEINGLSHFLEHMCFKGTEKRPREIDVASELDSLGAEFNAFTGHEYTGYWIKANAKNLEKSLDIVSDIYLNPVFRPEEINKEKGVIIEELNLYRDTPARHVVDIFMNVLYGDQPAGWNIGGSKEVINVLKQEDFLKYRAAHYLSNSTLVVVAGAFNEAETLGKIKDYFSGIKTGVKFQKIKTIEDQTKPAALVQFKESDQSHLVLGVRAFDIFDNRRFALQVLADILGGSMSSRLFQKVRSEMGAAYHVSASADLFSDHGFLAVNAGVDHKKIDEVVKAVIGEFAAMKEKGVSSEELQRAKDHLCGSMALNFETSDEIASFYGGQEIIKREIVSLDEVLSKIQSVSAEEIKAVAGDIFKTEKLNLALIGPFKDKDFGGILKL